MSIRESAPCLAIIGALTGLGVQPAAAQRQLTETVFSDRFDVAPGGTLQVDVPDGDVDIETRSGGGVAVEVLLSSRDLEWARERFEQMQFSAALNGNTVRITARQVRARDSGWRWNRGFSLRVRITMPDRFDSDIRTSDGDIFMDDVNGALWLETSDGDVDLGRVQGDEASIETSDGDVSAVALLSRRTTLRTSDGDIDVQTVSGSFEATTGDGDIRVHIEAAGGVRLRTGDGDITMYLPASLAASVDLDAEDLNVPRSFQIVGRINRRRLQGDMNGGGPLLEARTGDGSITLRDSRMP
jgi:hypothetical protein